MKINFIFINLGSLLKVENESTFASVRHFTKNSGEQKCSDWFKENLDDQTFFK